MDPSRENHLALTRRHFFQSGAMGLGGAALATLLPGRSVADPRSAGVGGTLPPLPHFAPKARRAIYLFMNGGPSQIDLFDYKPRLNDLFDKDLPESVRKGQRLTTMTSGQLRLPLAPSKFRFSRHGRAGTWVSELLPWTARMVD